MDEYLNNKKRPQVSVVMPAYNMERFLEEAVRSVMGQTLTDWELIIVDDCSSDDTWRIAEKLAAEDDRIRLVRGECNQGVAKTRNRGFDLCRGEYVALLDSDDVWLPEKLEKQLALALQTGAEIIYCSYGIVDDHGREICEDFIVPETTDMEDMLVRSEISCSTVLLHRRLVDQYRFRSSFYHEDLVLWLELLRDGVRAQGLTQVLAYYRVCEGSRASNKVRSAWRRWKVYREFMELSFGKSLICLIKYTILGLKKYRIRPGADRR